jgi:hypothetical protein
VTAYVNQFEAVRIVTRLMRDGEALASKMTDEWIKEGYGRWISDRYPDDAPHMIRMYGPDWRSMQPRVIEAFEDAVRLLNQILPTGRVRGSGVSDAAPEKGVREIAPYEWSSLRLNISRGILEAARLPAIRNVLLNREDLISEAASLLTPPKWGSNAYKRQSVDRALDKLTVPVLARMSQVGREQTVINCVAKDNSGLSVTDRYVRGRWLAFKEQMSKIPFLNVPNVH